jgi:hypothetical protein
VGRTSICCYRRGADGDWEGADVDPIAVEAVRCRGGRGGGTSAWRGPDGGQGGGR